MSINFCKFYNKIMNILEKEHNPVGSINVILGTFNIIGMLFDIIFDYIMKPIKMLDEYITKWICMPNICNSIDYNYISGLFTFSIVLFLEISFGYVVNHWIFWIILSPVIYLTFAIMITCIICGFNEKVGENVFHMFVIYPIEYIADKTTSHCKLKDKDKSSIK